MMGLYYPEKYFILDKVHSLQKLIFMESAVVLSITLSAMVVAVTGYGLYLSFGPPANQLDDPFDDHED
jgi:PsbN protein